MFSWDAPSDISTQHIDLYEEGSSVLFIRLDAAVSEHIVFHVSRTTEDSHTAFHRGYSPQPQQGNLTGYSTIFGWLMIRPLGCRLRGVCSYETILYWITESAASQKERWFFGWFFLFFFAVTVTFSPIETVQFLSPWWIRVTSTWWSQVDLRPVCSYRGCTKCTSLCLQTHAGFLFNHLTVASTHHQLIPLCTSSSTTWKKKYIYSMYTLFNSLFCGDECKGNGPVLT